ncbi:hypothetical protein ASA1KI_04290 [Opitutales bacterium ASA1]|nr:hypothetical protein ASA1KI_04290 [Opitutales bacterium ASA1]
MRPRFRIDVPLSREETRAKLLESFAAEPPGRFEVRPFREFVGLHIAAKERRYWSPRLFLSLEEAAEGGTRIDGTYGPEIEVWSAFLYGYMITGLLGTFSFIFGCVQVFVELAPWAFWVTGAMVLGAVGLYLAAQMGQKFGAWQTFQLHEAFDRAMTRSATEATP